MTDAIWTEKYRPQTFDDVRGQDDTVSKVRAFVEKQNMPHVLFTGPAGVGKTSLAMVIVKTLFGDLWRENYLNLNASDERGIDVVRVKVKDFARTKAIGNVPFKVIYLDECDALTKEAQQALRRTMENYTSTCRFILSANYSSKIIDPIQSRCAIFRFKPLPKNDLFMILEQVAAKENLSLTEDTKEALYEVSGGDCRRSENILQSCASLSSTITAENIFSMASVASPKELKQVLTDALAGNFVQARSELQKVMIKYGLAGVDVIRQIQKEVWDLDLDGRTRVALVDACGDIEFRMVEGADEFIQLEALLARFVEAGSVHSSHNI